MAPKPKKGVVPPGLAAWMAAHPNKHKAAAKKGGKISRPAKPTKKGG